MKVLFISHDATRTGAPIALLQEFSVLSAKCPDIVPEVLFLAGGDLIEEFKVYGRVYIRPVKSRLLRLMQKMKLIGQRYEPCTKWFKQGSYACIYANTIATFEFACILKKKLHIPLIGHVHELEGLMQIYGINDNTLSHIDHFITVSSLAKENLMENYGVPRDRISIQVPISMWVDRHIKNELANSPKSCADETVLIGCFISANWYKGIELFPIVLKILFKNHPNVNCKFAIVGNFDANTRWRLNYELKKTDVLTHVIWIDDVSQPMTLHTRFDVLLLLSREESFSLVAQEAALLHTPVVGFHNVIGIEEWLGDKGGKWVPYLDLEAIAESLYELIKDDKLRVQMGNYGHNVIEDLYQKAFDMEAVISALRRFTPLKGQ